MGGHSRAIDRQTGEVLGYAEKIDLNLIRRSFLVDDLYELLLKLSVKFEKKSQFRILPNHVVSDLHLIASGSTKFLFSLISDTTFLKYKPVVGDIDIMVSKDIKKDFELFLQTLEGNQITDSFKYLGQDRTQFGHTCLTVFQYSSFNKKEPITINIQIDFEYVDFCNGKPNEFSEFSHNSDWQDIINGLKGFAHKMLLTNIIRATSQTIDYLVLTPKSSLELDKLKISYLNDSVIRSQGFSVDKGLRNKFDICYDQKGNEIHHNGKILVKELLPEKSIYYTNLVVIFEAAFGKKPEGEEKTMFKSYLGLVQLMKKYLDEKTIIETFNFLIDISLFGKGQLIEKNPREDLKVKLPVIGHLLKEFPYLKYPEQQINLYYA